MNQKQWVLSDYDKEFVAKAAEAYRLPPLPLLLLSARGVSDLDQVKAFFFEDEWDSDPFLLADMDKAVARIEQALEQGEKIAVFGDYDADGVTATALLYSYLDMRGGDVVYTIPQRQRDGYGLNLQSLEELRENNVGLVITVDNGIAALEEVAHANRIGLDVIVTDHHLPAGSLPEAVAVVDPHRNDCPSPFKDYAGVGVAFQLIRALDGEDDGELLHDYSDLVALGTIADVVPLTGENRRLCKMGLRRINEFSRAGVESLKLVSGLAEKEVESLDVSFRLAPRINAAGRMGQADVALELLLSQELLRTDELIADLQSANDLRKKYEEEILQKALAQLEEDDSFRYDPVLVVGGEGWHQGVIGIVAAKLCGRFSKPCFVFSFQDGIAKGSGRSAGNLHLHRLLSETGELLQHFGGHERAVGVSLRQEDLLRWRKQVNDYAFQTGIQPPLLQLDAALPPSRLTLQTVDELEPLKPYGCGNEQPLFLVREVRIQSILPLGGGRHVKLTLTDGTSSFSAVCFGVPVRDFEYSVNDVVDVAVQLDRNLYGERVYLSVVVKELRFAGLETDLLFREELLYCKYRRGMPLSAEELAGMIPSREDCGQLYRFLKRTGEWNASLPMLYCRFANKAIGYCKMKLMLDLFEELRLIERQEQGSALRITLPKTLFKVDLGESKLLRHLTSLLSAQRTV